MICNPEFAYLKFTRKHVSNVDASTIFSTFILEIIKSICTYRSRDQWCKGGLPMDHLALRRIPLYPSGNEISWNLLVKEYTLSNLYDN